MAIYIVFIITIFALSHLGTRKYSLCPVYWKEQRLCNANELYLIIVGVICILIPTLRADCIGLDTIVYKDAMITSSKFDYFKALDETRFEPAYVLVQKIAGHIGGMILLQFIVAFTYIVGVCKLIKRYSNIIWLSFLFFIIYGFYYLSFNEMRQAMAMGIACYSFKHLVTSNLKKFLFWVLLASLFHTTALMLLPTYIFSKIRSIKFYQLIICLLLLSCMFKVSDSIFESLNLLSTIQYERVEMEDEKQIRGIGLLLLQLLTLSLSFVFRKEIERSKTLVISYFMLAYSIILFPICWLNAAMFRLEQYSWFYMVLLIPGLLTLIKSKILKFSFLLLYIIIGFYYGLTNYYTEKAQIIPYLFYWEEGL